MHSALRMLLGLVSTRVALAQGGSPNPPPLLTPSDVQHYLELDGERLVELRGHGEPATFVGLRTAYSQGSLPRPEESVVHYARTALGTTFTRQARMFNLLEADCVTWTEYILALALTDNWQDAYRLQFRLRFKDGQRAFVNLNQYPIADWMVNNAWLFEDVTDQLGAPVVSMRVYTNRRRKYKQHVQSMGASGPTNENGRGLSAHGVSLVTSYVPKQHAAPAYRRMWGGDLVLFIATNDDSTDGVRRPPCIHQGIVDVVSGQLRLLQCVMPEASEWPFQKYVDSRIARDRCVGFKVLRLRPGAPGLAQVELAAMPPRTVIPQDVDFRVGNRGRTRNGMVLIPTGRAPDREVVDNGVVYRAVPLRPNETQHSLFRGRWQHTYNLPANLAFQTANPDPHTLADRTVEILFPLRDVA